MTTLERTSAAEVGPPAWRRFLLGFAWTALPLTLALYLFVLVLDPYGVRASPQRAPTPIMDLNQRFMYPQIIRSGRFDAALIGTSTVRLIDPERLSRLFSARFANLGLNAGTPWEQMRIADLFLRHVSRPKVLIFGLDRNWCEPDADAPGKRLTFRAFPPWLYDERRLDDLVEIFNLKSLEIAGRVAMHRLGLMPERIRGDGFEVFVPPDGLYDLERARAHIWGGGPRAITPQDPPVRLGEAERAALRLPALAWLEDILGRVPPGSPVMLIFPPVHVAAQPGPGTQAAARDDECKARIAALGARHGAMVIDFRRASPVTAEDANYWDPLHFRLAIAERIATDLRDAHQSGRDAPDGFYRLLSRRQQPAPAH